MIRLEPCSRFLGPHATLYHLMLPKEPQEILQSLERVVVMADSARVRFEQAAARPGVLKCDSFITRRAESGADLRQSAKTDKVIPIPIPYPPRGIP
jgi:hypothetical protein